MLMEDDLDFDLGTGMTVITIVFEPDCSPQIELGGVNPLVAASVFRMAADILERITVEPTILINGQVVSSEEAFLIDLDDDDEM